MWWFSWLSSGATFCHSGEWTGVWSFYSMIITHVTFITHLLDSLNVYSLPLETQPSNLLLLLTPDPDDPCGVRLCVGIILLVDKCVIESFGGRILIDYEIYLFTRIWCCGHNNFFPGGWNHPYPIIPIISHLYKIVQYGVIVTIVPPFHGSAPLDEITFNSHCFLIIGLFSIIWNSTPLNIFPEIQ